MAVESTVLLVDDEPDVVETYEQQLKESYTTRTAHSGAEALEVIDETVDVVLLDRRMPGMTGDELLEQIRGQNMDCWVIMVTAVDPDLDIVALEFDEYLTKPVSGSQLNEAIDQMLVREQLDAQIQQIVDIGSKLATLEAKLDYEQLQESEQYGQLREEFGQLRDEIELADHEDDPYLEATVENIEALLPDV